MNRKDPTPGILAAMLVLMVMLLAGLSSHDAGTPASSLAFLGTQQPQMVVWKGESATLFQAPDGTQKLVAISGDYIRVGTTYTVKPNRIPMKWGTGTVFSLSKA